MSEVENQEVVENSNVEAETSETGAQVEESVSKKEFERKVNYLTARAKTSETENAELRARLAEFEKEKETKNFSNLTAEQRQKAELEKEIAKFEAEKADFARKQLTLDISNDLQEKGLPKSFAKALALVGDNEAIVALVDELVAEQQEILKNNLKQQLAGKPVTRNKGNMAVDKAQFGKMTLAERTELYTNNRELYNQLKN
jgi:hypothetical protein